MSGCTNLVEPSLRLSSLISTSWLHSSEDYLHSLNRWRLKPDLGGLCVPTNLKSKSNIIQIINQASALRVSRYRDNRLPPCWKEKHVLFRAVPPHERPTTGLTFNHREHDTDESQTWFEDRASIAAQILITESTILEVHNKYLHCISSNAPFFAFRHSVVF